MKLKNKCDGSNFINVARYFPAYDAQGNRIEGPLLGAISRHGTYIKCDSCGRLLKPAPAPGSYHYIRIPGHNKPS